ncbi:MAG: phage tail tape measure protein [Bacteroidetes bacterium]|nr:phage tail tape measure protein [Bacteroidota bacterium]
MPQKIENKDIFSPDFLEPQKKSFREIIELIKLMESEMKDVLKVQKELVNTSDKKSVEGLKKRQRAVQSVNQVSKEMLKLEKQRKSVSAQLAIAETQEAKAVAATRIELQRKKKAVKDEILAEKGLVSEYQKQSATLNNLRKKYKDLILVQGKETNATKKLRREITSLDTKLKKVDASVGQYQRSVGNYGKAFGKVTGVLRNFGLAVGGLAIIRNISGIVSGFEQSQADLASVLGVNVDEMKALTEQARELGATTRFTAGEVASLQKEFAKLGFDQTEIENMTEATLQLAAATGTELPRAAEVTGATLRGFGLDASETQRVVDVMAKSFSSSSLDMEKFATAMSSVAPVAKTAGLSVEKTTALLGTLTDRGLDASTAGTGLRNIFLELSKRGLSFEEAMLQINSATDKNAASLDLFGKRGATVGTILSETSEDVATLEGKLNDAGGAAKEMADKQLNTLNGALDLLKSAWEGFILDLNEGTGAFAGLKDILFFVAKNLTSIIKVVKSVALGWVAYRVALKLVNKETGKFIGLGLASKLGSLGKTLGLMTKGTRGAALGFKRMGLAMKTIPLAAWISGITTVVSLLWDFVSGTDAATEAQNELNKEKAEELRLEKEKVRNSDQARKQAQFDLKRTAALLQRGQKFSKEKLESIKAEAEAEIASTSIIIDNLKIREAKVLQIQNNLIKKEKEAGFEITGTLRKILGARARGMVSDELGISETENVDELISRYNLLQALLPQITKELKNQSEETEETKENTKKITKNRKIELTGLAKLKGELSDIRKLRSDELVINGETVLFQRYTDQTKELTNQIELLEARLKLSEEGFKAKKKEIITDVSGITGEEDLREEANNAVDDFVNIQVEGADEIADNDKKYYEQRLIALKSFAAKAIEIANAKTDKEISNIDKELDANKKRQDELQTLAAQGNLAAEQSIGAEIKRELELERQKEALEKKKARRQIIIEGLDLLSSKIDNGDKDAVTSTLNDMTRLLGALSALPGFIDGTETTVGAALGKPQLNTGVDDYIVRVDGSEKILNPNMSARTGNMTTEEITRAAEMYSSGMFDQNVLIHPQVSALNQPFQNSNEILKKFDSLESTIRNKPILSDLKFDDLQKALIVTVEQNGDLKRAHYKLK